MSRKFIIGTLALLLHGVICSAVLAAFALFSACSRPDPDPEPEPLPIVCGLEVDTNDLREVWVCETEDFRVTLKFLAETELTYSKVWQNESLPYQLLFADSVIYGYYIGIDSTLNLTKIYHDDVIEIVNIPFTMHRAAPDTVELTHIGFIAEPPFVLDYYKFHTIN
jgi:hypothetical protein